MKRRNKYLLIFLLVAILLLGGSYIYLFPAGGLEPLVSGTLNDLLPEELGLEFADVCAAHRRAAAFISEPPAPPRLTRRRGVARAG